MEKKLQYTKFRNQTLPSREESQEVANSLNTTIHSAMHDLRSPLNVIKPYVDFLKRVDDSERQERILNRMKSAVEKMELVISKFTKYSDLLCERMPEAESINFTEIYTEVKNEISQQYPDVNCQLELSNDLGRYLFLYPPKYLRMILKILLDNAFKYRSEERDLRVKVSVGMVNEDLLLELEDNGAGFPSYFSFEEAFIPFAKNANPYRGTGLGLASLKYMVEKNKGEIYGNSSEDGTAFILKLKPYSLLNGINSSKTKETLKGVGIKDLNNVARVS